jgi:hypothetical protein
MLKIINRIIQIYHSKKFFQFNVLTLVLILVLFVIGGIRLSSRVEAAIDETAIKNVVLAAFTAPSALVILPHPNENFSVPIASADISTSHGHAQGVLTSIYSANCATCQNITSGIDRAITAQANGRFRALGAGIKDIDWRQIVVNDNTASVTLAATLWSKVKFRDEFNKEHVVTPTAGFVEIFTLNKVGSNWVIMNQVQDDVSAGDLPVNKNTVDNIKNSPPVEQPQPTYGPQITPYKVK